MINETVEGGLTTAMKRGLLSLSRMVLEASVKGEAQPEITRDAYASSLWEKKGCFVTLEKQHRLRGCIGHILPRGPLVDGIVENTINAAFHDPRFSRVMPEELPHITIDISVLTSPQRLSRREPREVLDFLVPLKHGVILSNGVRQSTFLPQVWGQIPDKIRFLEQLSLKGGMSSGGWKDPETCIETYEAVVFAESDLS